MNNLPVELFDKVISNLTCSDLKSIRLTCKDFSDRAAYLVFELLHLSARPMLFNTSLVRTLSLIDSHRYGRDGKSRATSYCELVEVSRMVKDTVAPLVKTLIFSPAWCKADLLNDYDNFLRVKTLNEHQDTLEDSGQRRTRTEHYESQKRKREREALLLPQAKQRWGQLVVEQNDPRGEIRAAITTLIANMKRLENIILTDQTQLPDFMGIDLTPVELYDRGKETQQSNTWRFFSVLARGLHNNARHVKTLFMFNLNACDLGACIATNHAFTGLTELILSISDKTLLLQHPSTIQAYSLTGFLEYAAPTLQYLSLDFTWGTYRDYKKHAASFGAVLARRTPDPPTGTPIIFPQLSQLRFRALSMDTAALTTFLRHQPVLRKVMFDALLLAEPNTTWNDVASALPRSVESWQVRNVSQPKPNRPDQSCSWNPLVETLKTETGWEWDKDDFLQQHQSDATTITQPPVDRVAYLKSRHRFGTTKFARINNATDTAAQGT